MAPEEIEFNGDTSKLEEILIKNAKSYTLWPLPISLNVKRWENDKNVFYSVSGGPFTLGCIYYQKDKKNKLIASWELGLYTRLFMSYANKVFATLVSDSE